MSSSLSSSAPPGAPWQPLKDHGSGYLSVYLNEPLARWPIREVTRPSDNKSDPNIETGTYGLFSTCEPSMRRIIVSTGAATIVFMTSRPGAGRLVAGYYHVGWFAEGSRGQEKGDFALAADRLKFIDPVPPSEFAEGVSEVMQVPFRTQKPIGAAIVDSIMATFDAVPDRTSDYLAELQRIEQFSKSRSGYAYPSWGREQGFTWSDAGDYLRQPGDPVDAPNSSPTGEWRCSECDHVISNRALLKRCPVCGKLATLRPEGA